MSPTRIILHVDMDAFFAAVEQLDEPRLQGKPVIVGGPVQRGVVSTASYEARRFGVHSAMPMRQALGRCPHAVVLPVRMARYRQVSEQVMQVLHEHSPLVEPLSLDEAFLDMTGAQALYGSARTMAQEIQRQVREVTGGLTCSVGIGANKFLAKLASDLRKPNGITEVPFGHETEFLAPLPVTRLWGVGPRTAERLASVGYRTIGQLAQADLSSLRHLLGPAQAEHVKALSLGLDERAVQPDRNAKSIGSEQTLETDITGQAAVLPLIRRHCERIARRLRAEQLCTRSIRVKLRFSQGFRLVSHEAPLPMACDDSQSLLVGASALLERFELKEPIRLVGVAACALCEPEHQGQMDLFAHAPVRKNSQLEHTLDSIRARFGNVIRRADDDEPSKP